MSKAANIIKTDKAYVWHHLFQHAKLSDIDPVIMVKAQGMRITDINNREYLDATSGGVWTVNVGYARESIAKAVYEQLVQMPYYAGIAGSIPATEFSEKLIELLPHMQRVYYSNSGSEANEKAYKMVRQRAQAYNGGKKHKIIYRDRDYHGTTLGALSSTGQAQRRRSFEPLVPGFVEMPNCCCYRCPFGKEYGKCNIECATVLEDIIKKEGEESIGAVILEPITAGGGVIPPVKEYFPIISEICKKYDVLLHIDEVVCGMGRTGKWFGFEHYGIKPDIITMAKGLASGYAAISVTVTTEAVFDVFKTDAADGDGYFRDISTFGGCTAGPAAALESLSIIKRENLLENCRKMGDYLADKLDALKDKHLAIGDVRGKGLFAGIELIADENKTPLDEKVVGQVVQHCAKQGVLIGATNRCFDGMNNILTLSPALICSTTELDEIVGAIDKALTEVMAS